ncbi:MAG: bifunctional (p)ppGpp synthetase/guanosine-3',5'-bis(diphosphate) 3'-pyrophosphohydrolase [Clostridia bacterium]|nr:bifunctional (p)ppGpp synthetase/guanosine-3',5'-bis(diphosphate) 3'-pyrophosphohydrolase [Clostridia bacterium]
MGSEAERNDELNADSRREEDDYVDEYFADLENTLKSYGKQYNFTRIREAYLYARELHSGQMRQSGEPYIVHPVAVAKIAASLGLDTDSIVASLLHDVVEDCGDRTSIPEIAERFGTTVAELVEGLTKMKSIDVEDRQTQQVENIRKMLLAMSHDIRVIFIKLCDRLHNMQTLSAKPENKRRSIALETMYVYAPVAHRLGIQKIRQELEDLALSYLDPIGYAEVSGYIENKFGKTRDFLENLKQFISEKLTEYGIHFTLEGRVKTVFSMYHKIYDLNKTFDEIYDFYAVRIIVETELECYTVLGLIHELYKSVPGRFKDYISTPKPNMYQSLHTTVIGRDGMPFEVQIRTQAMHQVAEYGIAAHWKYKSGEQSRAEIDQKLQWISRLIESEDDTRDPDDFMDALKIDVYHDETFVFTPKGDIIALPLGATVIDFAYAIHSEVGHHMIGAKVNGVIAPITTTPKNGDIVEILTSASSKGPSRDWLKIATTGEAKGKIRTWFKKEKRQENIVVGKSEIDREFAKFSGECSDEVKNEIVATVARRMGIQSAEDLYNTLGYGGISMSKVLPKLKDEYDRFVKTEEPEVTSIEQVQTTTTKRVKTSGGIIVDGQAGCTVKFAKCCNPLPGDSVIGFITKGYGISIHKRDCPNVIASLREGKNDDRWVEASWDAVDTAPSDLYEALLQIYAVNSITIIADITSALAEMKVSILGISTMKQTQDEIVINLKIACKNMSHYDSIVSRMRSIRDVKRITRGFN